MVSDIFPPRRSQFDQHSESGPRSSALNDLAPGKQTFMPPNSVESSQGHLPQVGTGAPLAPHPHKRSLKEKLKRLSKKQWIIIIVALVLVLGGIGFGIYKLTNHSKKPVATKQSSKQAPAAVAPKTVASNLTGLQVDPSVNQRPVTGVMIENSTDARPQSGLEQADVVFEAVAEGGITRLLALFQDSQPSYIGPVRSARPYYLQWALGFDAALAHAGGSPEALGDIKSWGVKDLDQFANGGSYQRISSRFAPHNLYTSMSQLNDLESKKGFGASKYTSLARKADSPSKTPTARTIDVAISGPYFNSHYDYDAATNTYKRSQAGAAHATIDKNGGQTQIAPKVVVVMTVPQGIEADDQHTSYNTLGVGHVYVFQDGTVTEGNWRKQANNSQIELTDAKGATLKLDAGQTWFAVVGQSSYVSYKP